MNTTTRTPSLKPANALVAFPKLAAWPELPAATAVITRPGGYTGAPMLPQVVLRAAGLSHDKGLSFAVHGTRVLVRAGTNDFSLMTVDPSGRARLRFKKGLPVAVRTGKFAMVYGPGYLVLTTPKDALGFAPPAAHIKSVHKHGGLSAKMLPVAPTKAVAPPASRIAPVAELAPAVPGTKSPQVARTRPNRRSKTAPLALDANVRIRTRYPALSSWPKLETPDMVYTNLRVVNKSYVPLPIHVARAAGLDPDRGMHVASYNGRLLLWAGRDGGPVTSNPETRQLFLRCGELRRDARGENIAIVQGKGYLVITSVTDAAAIAPGVESAPVKRNATRFNAQSFFSSNRKLEVKAADILGWKDFNLIATTQVYQVQGTVLWLGGFQAGDGVRYFRYENACVLEKVDSGAGEGIIAPAQPGKPNLPRHNVGMTMFKTNGTVLRVVALRGRVVLCEPDSDIGALCVPGRLVPRGSINLRKFIAGHPDAVVRDADNRTTFSVGRLTIETVPHVNPLDTKNSARYVLNPKSRRRVQVQGSWLRAYGFVPGARFNVEEHPLFNGRMLLTLAVDGQYQVTTLSGTIPKLYIPYEAIAHFTSPGLEVFGTGEGLHVKRDFKGSKVKLGGHPKKTATLPLAASQGNTVRCPLKREITRLQVQGLWLRELGFVAGARYNIVCHPAMRNSLILELAEDGRHQVTTLCGDTPKLYVPPNMLTLVDATHVKVMGVPGRLYVMRDFEAGNAEQLVQGAAPLRSSGRNGLKPGTFVRYALKHRCVTVHGDWLRAFGFVAGARFNVEEHPLSKGRMLLTLAPNGLHRVTTSSGNTPRLSIPYADLAHFASPGVKVFGTKEGLHVTQEFKRQGRQSGGRLKKSAATLRLAA